MPLDPSIILGARPAQFDMAQFSPMNAMAGVMKFKQLDQENKINALKMQEYERARTEEEGLRNYLAEADFAKPETRTNLLRYGKAGAAQAKALSEQDTAALTQRKVEFEIQKSRKDFIAQAQRDTSQNPSDANITAYKEDLMANPLFTNAEKAQMAAGADRILAMPVDQRQQFMASQGASASELKPSTQTVNRGGATEVIQTPAFGGAPTTVGSYADVPLPANVQAQKIQIARESRPPAQPRAEQPPVAVIDPITKEAIFVTREEALRNRMQPASGAPMLKPLTEGQTIKLRADVSKDYKAASTALSQIDDLLASADAVKTSPGLSAATGFTGKFLPSFPEGGAAQAETRLANLRGKVTALGKATAAMSGAIGSIANQEWKILADQIAVLDEVKGKGPLLEQIALLEEQAQGAAARIRDTYEKSRAEDFERFPQFRDLPAPKAPGGNAPAAGTGGFKYLGKEGG